MSDQIEPNRPGLVGRCSSGSNLGPRSPEELEDFKARVRARLSPAAADGRLTTSARANAIIGRKPARE